MIGSKKMVKRSKTLVVVLLAIGIALSIAVLTRYFGGDGLGSDSAEFGKLPTVNRMNAKENSFALGFPARPGAQEMIVGEDFEYSWVGGRYPDIARVAKVYRRINGEWDLGRIQDLAIRFGFSDIPVDTQTGVPGVSVNGSKERGNLITPVIGADVEKGVGSVASELGIYRFIDGDSYLEVYGRDGRFFYENIRAEADDSRLPGKKEAVSIAKIFLKDVGFDQKGLSSPTAIEGGVILEAPVSDVTDDAEHLDIIRREPTFIEVVFNRIVDDIEIGEGMNGEGYRALSIMVGRGGNIVSASGELPSKTDSSFYPLIDVKEAFKKIESGIVPSMGTGLPEPALREGPESISRPVTEIGAEVVEVESVESRSAAANAEEAINDLERGAKAPTVEPMVEPMAVDSPDIDAPRTLKTIINIELDTVVLIYTVSFDDQGILYYQPGYLFSGYTKGSKVQRQILVDAIDEKYLK